MARSVCHLCEKENPSRKLEKISGERKRLRKRNRQYSSNGLRRRQPMTETEKAAELAELERELEDLIKRADERKSKHPSIKELEAEAEADEWAKWEAVELAKLELDEGESKLDEEEFEAANEALLQGERVLNKQKKEISARAKGWYTQKGCICKTEPKKLYRCLQNSCYWCEVDDNIGCKKSRPWRSWWWPQYSYDYLDRSMYPPVSEEELERIMEQQRQANVILSNPIQTDYYDEAELNAELKAL